MEEEFVKVRKRALERLTTEVMQMHDILPKILNGDIIENFQKLDAVEAIVEKKDHELEQLRMDCEHYKARLEAAQADCMKERKGKIIAIQQLHEAKQQLLQQAEYCTEMGAAVCTLLWSVSSNEDAVKTILGSSKAVKFFNIAGQTMESFVRSLTEDMKHQDLDSDESQFVLGLAGIITNVAALACGREFLINSSQVLLDTTMQLLGDMKPGHCTKLKVYVCQGEEVEVIYGVLKDYISKMEPIRKQNAWFFLLHNHYEEKMLMLMSLYNVSINVKGLNYISESAGFFPLLWWLLNDPDPEVCLQVLRLLQSVILEPEILTKSAPEMRDSLPLPRILMLSKSRNADLQILAQELLEDLKVLDCEK